LFFINNSAKTLWWCIKYRLYRYGYEFKVANCNFEQNNAPYGGAVQLKGKILKFKIYI